MAKKSKQHSYTDQKAFDRLMLLIATLIHYPGVGCPSLSSSRQKGQHHHALDDLRKQLQELAQSIGIQLPPGYPGTATLRKDLERLRDYQILERRMYRWGYYLGTGVMTKQELRTAFNALESQAKYQADPQVRQIYQILSQRLRGLDFEPKQDFFYPVRQILNRATHWTDPEEMMRKGKNRDTLFHQLDLVENAIALGQAIEISRAVDHYGTSHVGCMTVFPLQLIYNDIAWYLLYENCHDKGLGIGRINRFKNYCEVKTSGGRGSEIQKQSLENAYRLLENGWGLYLGQVQDQQKELAGKLLFQKVRVRFYPPVTGFIQEGELRHRQQRIDQGKKDPATNKPEYVDYSIDLPPRSLSEFMIWVQKHGDNAEVIFPPELAKKHYENAKALVKRYESSHATKSSKD